LAYGVMATSGALVEMPGVGVIAIRRSVIAAEAPGTVEWQRADVALNPYLVPFEYDVPDESPQELPKLFRFEGPQVLAGLGAVVLDGLPDLLDRNGGQAGWHLGHARFGGNPARFEFLQFSAELGR